MSWGFSQGAHLSLLLWPFFGGTPLEELERGTEKEKWDIVDDAWEDKFEIDWLVDGDRESAFRRWRTRVTWCYTVKQEIIKKQLTISMLKTTYFLYHFQFCH